jgi:hypothetical protein
MLFIDWNLQPANMTKNAEYTGYPVPTYAGLMAYKKLVADHPFLDVAPMRSPTGARGNRG